MTEKAALHPYGQRGSWRPPRREPGHCRYCDTPIRKKNGEIDPRRAWCSAECQHQGHLRIYWNAMRRHVLERDGERCVLCGTEHPGYNRLSRSYQWGVRRRYERGRYIEYCELGLWSWEVDHILPVEDGGTDDPANLRVLCHACHVASGVARRAAKRAQSHGRQESLELRAAS